MRSTMTSTQEETLHWMGSGVHHEAFYGEWQFRVWKWQRGSYLATAHNTETGETREHGRNAGELQRCREVKEFCECVFRRERDRHRAAGVECR